jgi:subtilisin family serine protease
MKRLRDGSKDDLRRSMKTTHVILRTTTLAATRDPFLGPLAGTTAEESLATGVSVEVEDIDTDEIPALRASAEVVAVARAIPMQLITPAEVQDAAQPAADTVTWGVKAVGAETSPFSGDGIVVAVLDTGIDGSHPAFEGVDIVQEDFTGEGNGDQNGHGTHCAGTTGSSRAHRATRSPGPSYGPWTTART